MGALHLTIDWTGVCVCVRVCVCVLFCVCYVRNVTPSISLRVCLEERMLRSQMGKPAAQQKALEHMIMCLTEAARSGEGREGLMSDGAWRDGFGGTERFGACLVVCWSIQPDQVPA